MVNILSNQVVELHNDYLQTFYGVLLKNNVIYLPSPAIIVLIVIPVTLAAVPLAAIAAGVFTGFLPL